MNAAVVSVAPTKADPLASLAREARHDRGALGVLLRKLGPSVLRVARGVLGADHPDVEDAVQEALVEIAGAMSTFRGECSVTHFACRIAARRAVALRRRASARGERDHRISAMEVASVAEDAPSARKEALRALLSTVPEEQAEALVLRFVLGLSLGEIAEASGAPINTVRSRLRLAKESLQRRVADDPRLAAFFEVGT